MHQRPENLLIIFCESLESWPVGLSLGGKEITPFLNELASDSTVYYAPEVLTQVKDGRSIDAQLLMLAGQMPLTSGVYSMKYASSDYHTIPQQMKEQGAKTYLLTADNAVTWNQAPIASAFGIDSLISRADWDVAQPTSVNRFGDMLDGELMEQSIAKMKAGEVWPEGERAFMLWVTLSGHNPFSIPEELDSLKLNGDYPEVVRTYLTAAHYTDRALRSLVEYLRTRSDFDRTAIAITGDHEGLAGYRSDVVADGRCPWVSAEQFTPLFVLNSPWGGMERKTIGQVDVYSALLDIIGAYDRAEWKGMGLSPFRHAHPGVATNSRRHAAGDTAAADSAMLRHQAESYRISDMMIRYNLHPCRAQVITSAE